MSEAKDDLIARLKPVAWRVKDYADGWIFYTDEKRARIEAVIMSGALVEPLYSADALSSLVRERDEARRVLRDHHKWHAESGILGIPDGDGGWIEMDNGAEYADSRLCQRTEETLRDMPPEFVVPPRGGWAMGSNHWENWQLAYRQKRAAEAERDEARAAHDADAKAFLVAIARVEAVEADAARMREALIAAQRWITNIDNSAPVVRTIRNAMKKDNVDV